MTRVWVRGCWGCRNGDIARFSRISGGRFFSCSVGGKPNSSSNKFKYPYSLVISEQLRGQKFRKDNVVVDVSRFDIHVGILSTNCGWVQVREVGRVCEITQLPWLCRYESRKIVRLSLGFCCSILPRHQKKGCL